jgi:hypothetical protein
LLDSSRIETLGNIWTRDSNSKLIYLNEDLEGRWTNAIAIREAKLIAGSDIIHNKK